MKLWELIVELEKLEQEGKRDYDVKVEFWSEEAEVTKEGIWADDDIKIIYV